MKRLTILLLAATVWTTGLAAPLPAQAPPNPGQVITLSEQLEKLLRVRLEEERIFLGRVLEAVQNVEMSEDLVLAVTYKARKYKPNFPFPYFRVMIEKVAESQGVPLGG